MANKLQIDLEKLEMYAAMGLTREQVAHNLGISAKTMQRRAKDNAAVEEAYLRGKSKGVGIIANALFKKAKEGNVTAQIFFLKCNGWKEASTVEVNNVNPQPVQLIIKNDLKD